MARMMRCPNCSRKLGVANPEAGRRLRCPKCQTPFTIGIGPDGHLVGFEIVDDGPNTGSGDDIIEEGFEVDDLGAIAGPDLNLEFRTPASVPPPKPRAVPIKPTPAVKSIPPPAPPKSPPKPPPASGGFDEIRLQDDPPSHGPAPDESADADFEFVAPPAPPPKPSAAPPRTPAARPPAGSIRATPKTRPPAEPKFEVVEPGRKHPASRRADDEEADRPRRRRRDRAFEPDDEEPYEDDYDDRYSRREAARKRWGMVLWGVTMVLIGVLVAILGGALIILGGMFAGGAASMQSMSGAIGGGGVVVIGLGLIALQGVLALIGNGLCVTAPAKNNAQTWAIITLVLGLLSISLFGVNFAISHPVVALIANGLELCKFFGFLFFLKSVGEALRDRHLAEEAYLVIKLYAGLILAILLSCGCGFIMTLIAGAGMAASMAGSSKSAQPPDMSGAVGGAMLFAAFGCIIMAVIAIYSVVVFIKYVILLIHARQSIAEELA